MNQDLQAAFSAANVRKYANSLYCRELGRGTWQICRWIGSSKEDARQRVSFLLGKFATLAANWKEWAGVSRIGEESPFSHSVIDHNAMKNLPAKSVAFLAEAMLVAEKFGIDTTTVSLPSGN